MIDHKTSIRQALLNNAALVSFLGGKKVWPLVAPDNTVEPYITFFEITNYDTWFSEDAPQAAAVHIQIDVWSKGNTAPPATEVDNVMKSLGYRRSGTAEMYERDTKTYHKVLRYQSIKGVI